MVYLGNIMPLYNNCSYNASENHDKKPLLIGCSGGGGHIAAIQGIRGFLQTQYPETVLPEYEPILPDQKPKLARSDPRDLIATGVGIMHAPIIGTPVQAVLSLTSYPVLPNQENLDAEITTLANKEKNKKRPYIDMLLDVYPAGYESAAIWNVLQKNDQTSELKKLIQLQPLSDKENDHYVSEFFLNKLKDAARRGNPYSEIISTQAMALSSLCNVVIEYNNWLLDSYNETVNTREIVIHQYMTDLPTEGAIHFFNALSTLTPKQQQQMNLYGVGMNEKVIHHFFPNNQQFNAIYNIPDNENPMVRPGFQNPDLDNSSKFDKPVSIKLNGCDSPYHIHDSEKISSIMLGSQAGIDTIEYIETMLENGMDKVFVFGGTNENIQTGINAILQHHPEYEGKIIALGNQGDKEIAPLMSRSNLIVIRGGGLSVMEQLAMNHHQEQTVLIHHANSTKNELSSGISWEDDNVKFLITNLSQQGIQAEKTSPQRAIKQIAQTRLIAAVKRFGRPENLEDIIAYIRQLPESILKDFVDVLKTSENGSPPSLPQKFTMGLDKWNKNAEDDVIRLNFIIQKLQKRVENIIFEEVHKILQMEQYKHLKSDFSLNRDIYNTNKIIEYFENPAFKFASPELISAIQNHHGLKRLEETISPENTASAYKKLNDFNVEFRAPETKKWLMSSGDNLFRRILQEIERCLAKYFPPLAPYFASSRFNFMKELNKSMNEAVPETESPAENEVPGTQSAFD